VTETRPSVCVIIPALNAAATVGRAVSSALAQPEAAEVVVVDDGSTDRTPEAALACDDGTGRLRILSRPRRAGPASARNLAIAATAAPWIALLDADDYMLPGRLAGLLAQAADADLVADDLLRLKAGDPASTMRALVGGLDQPRALDFTTFVRGNISRPDRPRSELGFLKPLIRRSFLDAHGLRYDERLRLGEDFILYARALTLGARFKLVPPCGYVSVERPDSLSARHEGADLAHLADACGEMLKLPLSRREAAAARAHRAQVAAKAQLRAVLDAKRAHGLPGLARQLLRSPATAPYVVTRALLDYVKYGRLPTLPRLGTRVHARKTLAARSGYATRQRWVEG
jgi:succinoglycan biosynthesis protein ExoU